MAYDGLMVERKSKFKIVSPAPTFGNIDNAYAIIQKNTQNMTNIFYVKVLQEEDKIALSVSVTQKNKNVHMYVGQFGDRRIQCRLAYGVMKFVDYLVILLSDYKSIIPQQ